MKRVFIAVAVATALLGACGDKQDSDGSSPTTTVAATSTTDDPGDTGIAMWPSPDKTFTTPKQAAEDFVSRVFDVPPELGEFGDGTIDVLSNGHVRATLALRQLGASKGWFVVSAGSKGVSITNLSTSDQVPATKLAVQGEARGFEGNVVARAYEVGDDVELSKSVFQAGSMGDLEQYRTTIDLSGAEPGSTIFIVVRGGTGLETDTGEFAAIPLVVK